ncbi:hypothetical protein ACIQM3_20745 [Streptomyces sp. NPDC091271]|uniref:hypothetical protein n=1 Tax=Streptomyces sp. NPDC091271 TaxID=3365980 RepID=UPI00382F1A61
MITAASDAFDSAYFTVVIVVTAVMAAGAVVTGLLLRHHGPGSALSAPTHH